MKTRWLKHLQKGLLLLGLLGAGVALVGCADEYAAYPGYYRAGYYGTYASAPYPYYGGYYGYPYGGYGYPYRAYGPYYGGYPYYGGASVVVSTGRSGYYSYRDRYGRVHTTRDLRRSRTTTGKTERKSGSTQVRRYDSDDERWYYSRP